MSFVSARDVEFPPNFGGDFNDISDSTAVLWLAAWSRALSLLPLHDATTQTMRRAPAVQVEHAQIYLIRGLFGVFSTGMDQMAAQLKAQGYSNVTLWSWTDVDQIAADIISGHQNGDNAHVILIGHSLGSNAVVQVADRIAPQGIPVDLAVTFDITEGLRVPLNVERFVNFYQNNGFGRPALEPAGFTGEFSEHQPVEPDPARSRQYRQRAAIAAIRLCSRFSRSRIRMSHAPAWRSAGELTREGLAESPPLANPPAITFAALCPGAPVTPPPGWVPEPHR